MAGMSPLPSDQASLLDWALYYHSRGWCIIPVDPETKKPCLGRWKWYQTERPTEQDLRKWFSGKYKAMAVICGAVSGNLGALDFDSKERCEWWNTTHPDLACALPTEKTTRGLHVLFHCKPVRTQRPDHQKVELICEGAYVILTPSPEKRWLNPPNGQMPEIDPFTLGLEAFGIVEKVEAAELENNHAQSVGRFAAPGATLPPSFAPIDSSQLPEKPEETEDPEDTEEPEDIEEAKIASVSSVSSVNLESIDAEKVQTKMKLPRSQLEVRWLLPSESYALLIFLATICCSS